MITPREVPALAGADAAAYAALHDGAVLVDRDARFRMTFTGAQAKPSLGGLVTNDVVALAPGRWQRAAALTPKGRVIALLRVADLGEELLVDTEAAAGPGFAAMIRKFVNPRLAKYADVGAGTRCLGVYGPAAAERIATALGTAAESPDGATLAALPSDALRTIGSGEERLVILRSTDLGVPGYDLIGAPARVAAIEAALRAAGLLTAGDAVETVVRVEAGLPAWGVDMDDETIPQEANLDALGAISFNKGCYTGQEVVARIHFRGHVNRHLRWLRAEAPIPAGATVTDAEGKEVGDVRSSVVSPRRGALALVMLRREVEPGQAVTVRGPSGDLVATVAGIGS